MKLPLLKPLDRLNIKITVSKPGEGVPVAQFPELIQHVPFCNIVLNKIRYRLQQLYLLSTAGRIINADETQ